MKDFNGKVLILDRGDINTDEIIPAKYLTEIERQKLAPHCLEDLKLEGFEPARDVAGKRAVVTRKNFGCGSSREHAPWSLEENGIHIVFAESFARIFRQNMYNCGLIAAEVAAADIDAVIKRFAVSGAEVSVDLEKKEALFYNDNAKLAVSFTIGDFEESLVRAGGWLEYADSRY